MKSVIVLPTYNERENIELIIDRLEEVFKKLQNHSIGILVVDDNSPDNTAYIVKKLQKKYGNLYLITGNKEGLGVAYLKGFDYAIKKLKADVVFEMDADLSHPAELIPEFMKCIDEGYDLVIGSRYIKGGATPDWNFKRRFISKSGNFFARIISGMYNIHDCTSGFRAIKTSLLSKINVRHLHTRGYAFQSTLLYELISEGANVKEIPLVFHDRKYGQSKLSTIDLIEFFFNAFRLRFKSSERAISFALIGASGILINIGFFMTSKKILFRVSEESNLSLLTASLIGDELSVVYNFFLNNFFTFKEMAKQGNMFRKLMKFHVIAAAGVIINNITLFTLHKGFGVTDILAKLMGILVAFTWNYFINTGYIWREKI